MPPSKSGIAISATSYEIQSFEVQTDTTRISAAGPATDSAIAHATSKISEGEGAQEVYRNPYASGMSGQLLPPKLLGIVKVPYPQEARAIGLQGVVEASLYVTSEGCVEKVEITKADHYLFREAAEVSFKQLKFEPALSANKPIASKIHFMYKFRIQN